MNKVVWALSASLWVLTGCSAIAEKKNEAATSLIERAVETTTGSEYDAADVNNIDKNNSVVAVAIGGVNISNDFKNGFGSITASKETIAITINGGENGQDNILLGFTGKDLTAERPIKGKIAKGENYGFTFSMMKVTENGGMEAMISFEAEGEIVSLQKDKIVIKVKGKIGSSLDAESPEKWQAYEGTITLNYPVFQALSSSKEDFMY